MARSIFRSGRIVDDRAGRVRATTRAARFVAFAVLLPAMPAGCIRGAGDGAAVPSEIDFAHLAGLGDAVIDLTNMNVGWLARADFVTRYESGRTVVDLVDIPLTGSACALFRDLDTGAATLVLAGTTNALSSDFNGRHALVWVDAAGGRVHSGYWRLATFVAAELSARLPPGTELTLAGFSQGGAIAALLPLVPSMQLFKIRSIVTLGQPRVVERSLAARLGDVPLCRLISADDPIPALPHEAGFAHFGRAILLLDGPFVIVLAPGDPAYDAPLTLPDVVPDLLKLDHATYRARLADKRAGVVYELPPDVLDGALDGIP